MALGAWGSHQWALCTPTGSILHPVRSPSRSMHACPCPCPSNAPSPLAVAACGTLLSCSSSLHLHVHVPTCTSLALALRSSAYYPAFSFAFLLPQQTSSIACLFSPHLALIASFASLSSPSSQPLLTFSSLPNSNHSLDISLHTSAGHISNIPLYHSG